MFKNRIRTAAIAGIAALATGISGTVVASPAFAQTTVQAQAPGAPAGEYFTHADASAAFNATPVDHTEEALKLATDETSLFITDEVPAAWGALHSQLNFDPSEEARAADVREILDLVLAEQAYNDGVIHDAQEAVAYAFEKDQEAAAAWDALVAQALTISDYLYTADQAVTADIQDRVGVILYIPAGGTEADRKPLSEFEADEFASIVELINLYAGYTGADALTTTPAQITAASTPEEQLAFINALPAFQAEVTSIYNRLGDFTYDQSEGQYAARYYKEAVEELNDTLATEVAELDRLNEISREANRVAQGSDVLVRQGYLERAVAQRDLLRNWEGYLLAWARYIELYNDPTLTGDRTLLSTEYREILEPLAEGIERNTAQLAEADEATASAFWSWIQDLRYNSDGDWAIVEERLEFSQELYANIYLNGAQWREALNRVIALENELGQPSDTDRLIEALENLLENNNNAPAPAPTPADNGSSASSVDAELSSGDNAGVFGIVAVIAAILAAIGLALPALNITLPF